MKKTLLFLFLCISLGKVFSQSDSIFYKSPYLAQKKLSVSDTIVIYSNSIYPDSVKVFIQNKIIPAKHYEVNYASAKLFLKKTFYENYSAKDTLTVEFKKLPDFLTESHQVYSEEKIFPNVNPKTTIIYDNPKKTLNKKPFQGLITEGSLLRGVSIGNNQDAVTNAALDLSISGKLSSQVTLKAHINDTNVPLQENGYSQELKDIERIYIALTAPKWQINAGDVIVRDTAFQFIPINRKVQGLALQTTADKIKFSASGAMVKGRFTSYQFQGKENNQGPYKLQGNNGEPYIFIINDSEKVYVDGILQKKGADKDYVIDYNTAEITFMVTRPIHAENRIIIEYQYSERNYTRLITYNTVNYNSEKFKVGLAFYNENDLKNESFSINLTDEQKNTVSQSDTNFIYLENAVLSEYAPYTIRYKKNTVGTQIIYVYDTTNEGELYDVKFTYFGAGLGDYNIQQHLANGKVMVYVGENQGSYRAVVPFTTPETNQIISLNTQFSPSNKTQLKTEVALNNYKPNLYNPHSKTQLPAISTNYIQNWLDKKWTINTQVQWDYLDNAFKSSEKLRPIDFDRYWNTNSWNIGSQSLWAVTIEAKKNNEQLFNYRFENLSFTDYFTANRHSIAWKSLKEKWKFNQESSFMSSKAQTQNTQFFRNTTQVDYLNKKGFFSSLIAIEHNQLKDKLSQQTLNTSFGRLKEDFSWTVGDTTKIFMKTQVYFTQNDSVRDLYMQRVNQTKNLNWQIQWLKNKQSKLNIYFNYRNINYINTINKNNFNSQIKYQKLFAKEVANWQTDYKISSGQIAQQDYTYVATESGQGFYTWIDYNQNNQQEIDEFEVATFADQANFLRVLLPNITYLPTQEVYWQQSLQFNFNKLKNTNKLFKLLSYFNNRIQVLAQNAVVNKTDAFHFNPFVENNNDVVLKTNNISNILSYNNNKKQYQANYTFQNNEQKTWQSFGFLYQKQLRHEIDFQHLTNKQWNLLINLQKIKNESVNETYINRNFNITSHALSMGLGYWFSNNHQINLKHQWTTKINNYETLPEQLNQQKLSANYFLIDKKSNRFDLNISYLNNHFSGNLQTAVAYQMLEGLQTGKNATWQLLWQHKINSFLFLNLSYNGRSNSISRTIHNGSIQLRAQF